MAEILMFHHALGLTSGVVAFADAIRAEGHVVHLPDLYDGKTFTDLDEGVGHARDIGFDKVREHGRRIADGLPHDIVYAGLSLGIMPAQELTQTRPGARGALLLHGSAPLDEFGGKWPDGVPLQMHTMDADDWGDVEVARALAEKIPTAQLFEYPGDDHLFTDNSIPAYNERFATQVKERVLAFLSGIDAQT
jgi:dienelactone hydrolase